MDKDRTKRAQLSAEALFEVESFLKLSAADVVAAATFRSAWYQAVRSFFEQHDYLVLPSAQVFPFDAGTPWPKEVAGKLAELVANRRCGNAEPPTFATVYPLSGHDYELRYWLASAGIDPDADIWMVVLPPPFMADALKDGRVNT